jgi:hypothetical protein
MWDFRMTWSAPELRMSTSGIEMDGSVYTLPERDSNSRATLKTNVEPLRCIPATNTIILVPSASAESGITRSQIMVKPDGITVRVLFGLFKATIRRLWLVGWRPPVSIIVAISIGPAAVGRYHDAESDDGGTHHDASPFIIRLDWATS